MKVFKTPNTGGTHTQSVWDEKKATCGKAILDTWTENEGEIGDITCDKCMAKLFGRRRKFTPARRMADILLKGEKQ